MKTILIVDDNPFFTTTLGDLLTAEGFDVLKAHSGEEAVDIFDHQAATETEDHALINLLVTDLVMPGMDGFELAQFVKRKNKSSRFLPVIMLTEKEITKEEARQKGCSAYVPKSEINKVVSMAKILLGQK